ncbi:AraC family transcriptional regulator [Tateyamaria omphalii]|uniref:helix-turn-helix domain-containing protein n=1 Tax=Tateyamaria omphalii TaxID=299262 RepID=UPI001678AD90|nr:helix-turn-helix domain-containing protein [Tateyamaria omphalii]GGX42910.1 AraC family transcriptional regulator [Tateyamaria omphalii]
MIYLDLGLRSGAITMLLLFALLMWRAPVGWEGRLSVVALALCKSAFLVTQAAFHFDLPPSVESNLILLTALTPAAITWFIVSIFLDGPRLRWPWAVAALVTAATFYIELAVPGGFPFCVAFGVGLYGALVLMALWTARDDLVECRCRARPAFAVAIAGLAFALTGGQAIGIFNANSMLLALLQAAGTFGVCVAFALWLLRPEMERWPGKTDSDTETTTAPVPTRGADTVLIGRIKSAMAAGIWREEGLTIGALAAKLAVPEHRLRQAINQGLGHRNFSSFINRARIEAACQVLQDPAHMHTTMLEVAYDVGFSSMGPFNRAFRAEIGHSPTEYRRMALSERRADSERSSPIPANLH